MRHLCSPYCDMGYDDLVKVYCVGYDFVLSWVKHMTITRIVHQVMSSIAFDLRLGDCGLAE